ncbi:BatD family protein [Kineobactrum sediminis]|nr:BatD family protein [Kineobactrum sediminis]
MKRTGSQLALCALLLMFSSALHAAFDVSVDRRNLALGDSFRLVITSTGNEDLNDLDLRLLLADFEILQRGTSSNTNIINGQRSRTRQLTLDLLPRREGTAYIPAFSTDAGNSEPIAIEVGPTPTVEDGDQSVLFEAEVDRTEVYVQEQIVLTLRIQQAINLDNRSISDLQLANAFAKPLEQKSFQRNVNGQPRLVHEVRYAIFPEQSGTLEIPVQVFTARESQARRRAFDFGSSGRQVQRRSEPLTVTVKPRPDAFPGSTWLPARNLILEESWSAAPEQLQAGESVTRTISLRGEGLQGAQLPPVEFVQIAGLKYYPDQPRVEDREDDIGLVGLRQDSAALVATASGNLTLPELRIPWWDTEADTLRHAVLPARNIVVSAAPGAAALPAPDTSAVVVTSPSRGGAVNEARLRLWQILTLVCALGWLATVVWHRRQRGQVATPAADKPKENRAAGRAFKRLQAACASNSAAQARQALLAWGQARLAPAPCQSLATLTTTLGDPDLSGAVSQLDRALYGDHTGPWDGTALLAAVTRHQQAKPTTGAAGDAVLDLYPGSAR